MKSRFCVSKFFSRDGEITWQLELNSLSGKSFGVNLVVGSFRVHRSNPSDRWDVAQELRMARRALRDHVRQLDAGQTDQKRSLAHYTRMRNRAFSEGHF